MDLPAKFKAIRAKEKLTQAEFCALVEISISSWKKYEASIIDMGPLPPESHQSPPFPEVHAVADDRDHGSSVRPGEPGVIP